MTDYEVIDFCCFIPHYTEEKEGFVGGEKVISKRKIKPRQKTIKSECEIDNFVDIIPDSEMYIPSPIVSKKKVTSPQAKSDLHFFHNRMNEYFTGRKDNLDHLNENLKNLKWIKDNSPNKIEKRMASKKLFQLTKEINKIKSGNEEREYERLTRPIFDEYDKLNEEPYIQDFICSKIGPVEEKRYNLMKRYVSVCNRFLPLDQKFEVENQYKYKQCLACNNSDFDVQSEQIQVCLKCGVCLETVEQNSISYRDTTRINMAPRFNYTRRGHFKEAMDKFEGKQNTTIPERVFEVIKDEMKKNDISKSKLTKDHIFTFLQQYGYGDYYEDTNLIHFRLTGKPPPDISKYRTRLLELNDIVEKDYDEVKNEERVNALNVYYKLYKLLDRLGYECKMEDFNFLKTRAKIIEHDEVMGKIFNKEGWDFTQTV